MSSLTPFVDMTPVPRVQVIVEPADLLVGTESVTLRRLAEGRYFLVRGAIARSAVTTFVAMDFEAPFQVESAYEALCYDATDVYLGTVQLGAITLAFGGTVVQQPLNPKLSVLIDRMSVMAESSIHRPTPGGLVHPEGAGLGMLVGTGPRRGVEGYRVGLAADTLAQADALQATLGTYDAPQLQAWLLRTPPPQRIPRVFFCHVPDLEELEITVRFGGERVNFLATVTEMQPPAPGLSAAVLRHSDIKALFSTHTQVEAVYTLHSDIKQDQSLVGAGG